MMATPTQNVFVAAKQTAGVRITLCTSNTNTFVCTSYPVFSEGTTDGTNAYLPNSALKQLSPPGLHGSPNNPSVTYSSVTKTGLITFNYGLTFDPTNKEYQAASSPRRYKYILAVQGYSPSPNRWVPSHTASDQVILHGQVDVYVPKTQVSSSITICSLQVV